MRGTTERIIHAAETLAACFLAFVTALTFVAVVLRYVFSWTIPDSYDASRLLLGVMIFWGIAVTGYRGDHITVELLYNVVPRRGRHVLDVLATLFTLLCMAVFTWAMLGKVLDAYHSGETTFDLHVPLWPAFGLAWVGLFGGVLLLVVRLLRVIRRPASVAPFSASH
ncbi:MAG: TRAP transporter small permease [Rhodospirillales bacterium]|nr:TRAP transporter small permease [Rhodospirillales bacterium]MDE2198877.1 TRAP transporter small permease [Rhodospirillales bacterium]MDE2574298.1 TRAP transporter small permease [Rhodospirillales bacterium]